jgi:hypothetical protein
MTSIRQPFCNSQTTISSPTGPTPPNCSLCCAASGHLLPGYLRVHFEHEHFTPMQLQYWALKLTSELDRMKLDTTGHALRVGRRGSALRFAMTLLSARQRFARQARILLARVEQAMAANGETPH